MPAEGRDWIALGLGSAVQGAGLGLERSGDKLDSSPRSGTGCALAPLRGFNSQVLVLLPPAGLPPSAALSARQPPPGYGVVDGGAAQARGYGLQQRCLDAGIGC